MTLSKGVLLRNRLSNHFKEAKPLYISKTKFGNVQRGHVLVISAQIVYF